MHARAARTILGVPPRCRLQLLLGELGWLPIETQLHIARLRYWNRLQRLDDSVLAKQVFCYRFTTYLNRERRSTFGSISGSGARRSRRPPPAKPLAQHGFCTIVHSSLQRYGLLRYFQTEPQHNRRDWMVLIRGIITEHARRAWLTDLGIGIGVRALDAIDSESPTIRFYRGCKTGWGPEPYLQLGGSMMGQQRARSLRAQLRTGTAPLAAIESRHHHGPESTRPSPLCIHCDLAAVDDQAHVLCVCPLHEDDRTRLILSGDVRLRLPAIHERVLPGGIMR